MPPRKSYSQILSFLFVGSQASARNKNLLSEHNINHILTVSESIRFIENASFQQFHFPLSDFGESSLVSVIDQCSEVINAAKVRNEKFLIHCHMGQNRSPSVVTGYLMKHCGMNLSQAFHQVKAARPQFAPHENYLKQLQDLDLELYGKVSLTENAEPISVQAIKNFICQNK